MMAFASVAITLAIVAMLVKESFVFFEHVSLWDFLDRYPVTPCLMTRTTAYFR